MTTKESGFTIVELLIYMAMFVVVLGAMYSIMISNTRSYSSQENRVEMTQDLRAAMNLMVREIRMAGCDPTDIDSLGFADDADDRYDTDANSIHFTMDIDASGAIANSEDINYYLYTPADGIQKIGRRTGDGDLQPVAENITGLTFIYMYADGDRSDVIGDPDDTDGDDTNDLEDIERVQISITGETATVDAVTGAVATRTQTTWVVVRNAGVD
jgi:type IV pilus assembly protein PilW